MHRPKLLGQMVKLAIELSEHDIIILTRSAVKVQALTNFIADFTPLTNKLSTTEDLTVLNQGSQLWTLLVDGIVGQRGSGLGIILITPEGDMLERAAKCEWRTTIKHYM